VSGGVTVNSVTYTDPTATGTPTATATQTPTATVVANVAAAATPTVTPTATRLRHQRRRFLRSVTVTEGNSGTTQVAFTVSLNRVSTSPVTVQFATHDGTATSRAASRSGAGPVPTIWNPSEIRHLLVWSLS